MPARFSAALYPSTTAVQPGTSVPGATIVIAAATATIRSHPVMGYATVPSESAMRQPRLYLLAVLALSASVAAQGPPAAAPQPLVLTHVNVVDVAAGKVRPDEDVTIRDGRIAAVAPSGTAAPPAGVRAIDAKGKFLIPGLADMHVHWYDERYLGLFVANGVTSVRTMWGFPMQLDWRKRIDAGALLGPRFTIASAIVDGP